MISRGTGLRHDLSLILSFVYLVGVLLVPAWHVAELTDGHWLDGGGCVSRASADPVLEAPCPPHGPCPNPNHHHSERHHGVAPCPRCSGLVGPAAGDGGGCGAAAVEDERPLHSRTTLFVPVTLADVSAARAPPLTV